MLEGNVILNHLEAHKEQFQWNTPHIIPYGLTVRCRAKGYEIRVIARKNIEDNKTYTVTIDTIKPHKRVQKEGVMLDNLIHEINNLINSI